MKRIPLPSPSQTSWCCWKPAPLGIDIFKRQLLSVVFCHFSPTLCSVNSSCSGHCWAIRKVSERHSRRRLGLREVLFSADTVSKREIRQTALWWPIGKRVKDYQLPRFKKKKESRKPWNDSQQSLSAKLAQGTRRLCTLKKNHSCQGVLKSRLRWISTLC